MRIIVPFGYRNGNSLISLSVDMRKKKWQKTTQVLQSYLKESHPCDVFLEIGRHKGIEMPAT